MVVILFGVTGAGKTVIGRQLARELGWRFFDGDTFHASQSLEKLRRGIPLSDEDRWPWLDDLRALVVGCLERGEDAVLACSALKHAYREHLRVDDRVVFVHLKGDYARIAERLRRRHGHFMNPELLESQFATLEEPRGGAIVVDVAAAPEEIVREIRAKVSNVNRRG